MSRESTLIVGELPCGKGSLLRELERSLAAVSCRQSFIAAQTLPSGSTPEHFWSRVLQQLGSDPALSYEYRDIERALRSRASDGPSVLMIDDLHTFIHMPGFASPDMWGMLRAFTQSKALTLVCTSNVDLVELTDRTMDLTLGSPFFNAMRELVLGPLGADDVARLLDDTAPGVDEALLQWVLRCCGGHPQFVGALGSWLGAGLASGEAGDGQLRRRALAGCRQEIRHVFSGVWPLFPWEERWMMLRIAVTQRCAQELPSPSLTPVVSPAPDGERERAFVELLEGCLSRGEVKRLMDDVLGKRSEAVLPGDSAGGGEFFYQAADILARRGLVLRFLECLRQWSPHRAADIEHIAALWGQPSRVATAAWQPLVVHCERLLARGVVSRSLRAPGWEITPALLYWWLLDQVQLLVGGYELSRWLAGLKLTDGLSLAEGRLFLGLVQRHQQTLAAGAHPLTESFCL